MPEMGNLFRMRGGFARGEDAAPGSTRRVVRLLVLLGLAAAAYFVLSLFEHAARADTGSIDPLGVRDSVASVKGAAGGVRKAVPPPRKIEAPRKTHASPKVRAATIRAGHTVRQVRIPALKVRRPTSGAVRTTVTSVRKAVVRQIPSRPVLSPHLPRVLSPDLPDLTLPQPPSWAPLPELPHPPTWAPLPGLPQVRTPISTPAAAPYQQALPPPASVRMTPFPQLPALAPGSGLSGVTTPPAAPARPRTAPPPASPPASPPQPADPSASTGQVRESGGGSAPAMATVASSWRPEMRAAGRRLPTDHTARGRVVRYAGPPS